MSLLFTSQQWTINQIIVWCIWLVVTTWLWGFLRDKVHCRIFWILVKGLSCCWPLPHTSLKEISRIQQYAMYVCLLLTLGRRRVCRQVRRLLLAALLWLGSEEVIVMLLFIEPLGHLAFITVEEGVLDCFWLGRWNFKAAKTHIRVFFWGGGQFLLILSDVDLLIRV